MIWVQSDGQTTCKLPLGLGATRKNQVNIAIL